MKSISYYLFLWIKQLENLIKVKLTTMCLMLIIHKSNAKTSSMAAGKRRNNLSISGACALTCTHSTDPSLYFILFFFSSHPLYINFKTYICLHSLKTVFQIHDFYFFFPLNHQIIDWEFRLDMEKMVQGERGVEEAMEVDDSIAMKGVRHLCENIGITRVPSKYIFPLSDRPQNMPSAQKPELKLPIIDIAELLSEDRTRVLETLDKACKEYGFFQVKMKQYILHRGLNNIYS